MGYIGRFAPSPTGPLHAGSLVAALASWLDARASSGRWLVRIEDVDPPRCQAGAAERILAQLAACGLHPDEPPLYQSRRTDRYQQALDTLRARGLAYPCACTRRDIDAALAARGLAHQRHVERPYPGTCRAGLGGRAARACRFHTEKYQSNRPPAPTSQSSAATFSIATDGVRWHDRRLGAQHQDVAAQVGDLVLRRADGLWSYQLAVVVDDAEQGITHIVRGEDLTDNTPRQILLQSALGLPTPRYLHAPLVRGEDGEKLSKQHGAPAIDETRPLAALAHAAQALGLPAMPTGATQGEGLALWVRAWARIYNHAP
ncbi:MAG TPA: tRNA glutamyl-Q(34) synthetase GluQRS [Comamonadaceae bacterium]|uniref:tRNA glutamyl-Q(34) synthetase GluQRS n=1 Tax=Pulveribacter sp. TaxID=2678893 RepID=UPI000EEE6521|nr:tRNA glutamyl-Q(34) synthetase GluQRS [Pulveribacter sp.]HCL85647.1 tRNA glutamyl-Q(34) synthetase GluQRS [Comamonadaceae bacterium]